MMMMLLLLLVSLFAVGCGDSGEDFVVVGNNANNNAPVPTTAVNFQFARAQANITANVPLATTRLHIDFLTSADQEVFETEVDFNTTVTVNGVPITATQAVVTALDRNGIPLRTVFYSLALEEGVTANALPLGPGFPVTFQTLTASPNPLSLGISSTQQLVLSVSFSNGDSLSGAAAGGTATFTSARPAIANVTSTGLVRGISNGTTSINVTYSLNNVTRSSSVDVTVGNGGGGGGTTGTTTGNTTGTTTGNTTGTTTGNTTGTTTGNTTGTTTGNTTGGTSARIDVTPETLALAPNTMNASGPLMIRYFPANSTTSTLLDPSQATVTFSGAVPAGTENRYGYDPTDGRIDTNLATGAAEGSTVTANVIVIRDGVSLNDTVAISINTLTSGQVASARISSVVGSSLRLPSGSTYPLIVEETLRNGTVQNVAAANLVTAGATAGQYTVAAGSASATYASASGVLSFPAVGTGTITVTRNNSAPAGGAAFTATLATDTVNTSDLVDAPAKKVALVASSSTIKVGTSIPYRVELRYKSGINQNITPVVGLTISGGISVPNLGGNPAAGVNLGVITAVTAGPASFGIDGTPVLTTGASFPSVTAADYDVSPVAVTVTTN